MDFLDVSLVIDRMRINETYYESQKVFSSYAHPTAEAKQYQIIIMFLWMIARILWRIGENVASIREKSEKSE
jgi:hypothetical protein